MTNFTVQVAVFRPNKHKERRQNKSGKVHLPTSCVQSSTTEMLHYHYQQCFKCAAIYIDIYMFHRHYYQCYYHRIEIVKSVLPLELFRTTL